MHREPLFTHRPGKKKIEKERENKKIEVLNLKSSQKSCDILFQGQLVNDRRKNGF